MGLVQQHLASPTAPAPLTPPCTAADAEEQANPCICTPRQLAAMAATLLNMLLDCFSAAEAAGGFLRTRDNRRAPQGLGCIGAAPLLFPGHNANAVPSSCSAWRPQDAQLQPAAAHGPGHEAAAVEERMCAGQKGGTGLSGVPPRAPRLPALPRAPLLPACMALHTLVHSLFPALSLLPSFPPTSRGGLPDGRAVALLPGGPGAGAPPAPALPGASFMEPRSGPRAGSRWSCNPAPPAPPPPAPMVASSPSRRLPAKARLPPPPTAHHTQPTLHLPTQPKCI